MHRTTVRRAFGFAALCGAIACGGATTSPDAGPLALGRWTGGVACLSVADTGCNLTVGCGHGQFPRPTVRPDGTFDVDGTYRVEVGPVSTDPAPAAHFSGSVSGSRLVLTVTPASPQPAASYTLTMTANAGACVVPCL
jgi:hypothetical protein